MNDDKTGLSCMIRAVDHVVSFFLMIWVNWLDSYYSSGLSGTRPAHRSQVILMKLTFFPSGSRVGTLHIFLLFFTSLRFSSSLPLFTSLLYDCPL